MRDVAESLREILMYAGLLALLKRENVEVNTGLFTIEFIYKED